MKNTDAIAKLLRSIKRNVDRIQGLPPVSMEAAGHFVQARQALHNAYHHVLVAQQADHEEEQRRPAMDTNLTLPEQEAATHDKIHAIRLYRLRTNLGLKEAKEAVEKWMDQNLKEGA